MPARILLIEEEHAISQGLRELLRTGDYQFSTAKPEQAEDRLALDPPDLAILSLRHLGKDNRALCQRIFLEARSLTVPLIFLTGGCDEGGLPQDLQACLVSPIPSARIATAVKMLLQDSRAQILAAGEIFLRLDTQCVYSGGVSHHLSPRECRLLETFLRYPARELSRSFLMREVWNTDFVGDTRTLDVYIHFVRKKIEPDPSRPRYVRTIRGVGYRFLPTS